MILFDYILVGKTSLITRFMYDSFDNTYHVSFNWFKVWNFRFQDRLQLVLISCLKRCI
jgi:GTPase SAR1 family protein